MILSASRRTDIPAYYSEWFFNRLKEGQVMVRNPMNIHQVNHFLLSPETLDCIVFWSKNPKPVLDKLNQLQQYPFYFQFTLNAYSQDIETNLPKKTEILDTFRKLSDMIGPHRVIWRYDPILINSKYTLNYHIENFELLASRLKGYTEKVTISFVDFYTRVLQNVQTHGIRQLTESEKQELAAVLSKIAKHNLMLIDTCAEDIDLSRYGISHARCIDDRLIERIIGYKLEIEKDKNQRLACGCIASIDIGAYNTCGNGCLYCYANYNKTMVTSNVEKHNPHSQLLYGCLSSQDIVNERLMKSNKKLQQSFLDSENSLF